MGFQGFPRAGIAKAVPKSNGFSKEVASGQGFPGGLAWPNYNIKRSNGEIRVRLGCSFENRLYSEILTGMLVFYNFNGHVGFVMLVF